MGSEFFVAHTPINFTMQDILIYEFTYKIYIREVEMRHFPAYK